MSEKDKKGVPTLIPSGPPIPVKRFMVQVVGVARQTIQAMNKDEAGGFVKGYLRGRNPDFQFSKTKVMEIKMAEPEDVLEENPT